MVMGLDFDVVDLPETDHVGEGEAAPDFTRPLVNDEYWTDAAFSEVYDGGGAVLVFYPMDGDFPATYIWQEIRDREWTDEFAPAIVGLSISTPYEHKEFLREWRDFEQFELFSDPANGVAEAYGVVNDLDGMTGIEEARPAVFVVDEEGTVDYAWVAETWPDFPPYDEVERAVDRL